MPAVYLSESDVEKLLDLKTSIDVVEECFRRMGAGEAENVPRVRAHSPGIVLHTMSAAATYLGVVGWKSYTTTRSGARFLVGIYDAHTGELAALIEADRLGQLRTAATTAVAIQWMALPEATEVGLFGAGYQAEAQLEAATLVRSISTAYVYSRHDETREEFTHKMAERLSIEVVPVDRPQGACEDLPIVITATTSREPVFDGMDLAEGTLVCAVGSNWLSRAEIDADVIRRADNIVCDSIKACRGEAGDFVDSLEKGIFDWSRAVDLAEVITGHAVGRNTRDSIALFKSVGLAVEDIALSAKLLELAREEGIGIPLPF